MTCIECSTVHPHVHVLEVCNFTLPVRVQDFETETKLMSEFYHQNIVNFYAAYKDPNGVSQLNACGCPCSTCCFCTAP